MTGIACAECGGPIRVRIEGGDFLVRKGSTLDNINFEKNDPKLVSQELDEDVMLTVHVECQHNPDHMIFGTAASKIKVEIYTRIMVGAQKYRAKYFC
ncbi:hypothetical protein KKH23_04400 [Patescibacteria group bacterium]|nr:hypothetical protein [Patescibacteria group bacterium]